MTWGQWLSTLGAVGFGAIIGWFVYYINRYRKGDVQFSDLTTIIAILGGGVVVQVFNTEERFGAYGIGLFLGFFGYFVAMVLLIRVSPNFDADFLLDGRRRVVDGTGYYIPSDLVRPAMDMPSFRAQAPMLAPLETVAVAASSLSEETRQAKASAEELRTVTLNAQRTLGALAQAMQDTESRTPENLDRATATGA